MFVWRILFYRESALAPHFGPYCSFAAWENGSEVSLSFFWDSPMDRECKLGGPESGLIRKSIAHFRGV